MKKEAKTIDAARSIGIELDDGRSASSKRAGGAKATSDKRSRRATGPRTPEGKRRSSQNAVTHMLFAKSALPPNVRWDKLPAEYRKLHGSLAKSAQPETPMEEMLVEVIATAFYRWRAAAHTQTWLLEELQFDAPPDESISPEVRDRVIEDFMKRFSSEEKRLALLEALDDPPEANTSDIRVDPAIRLREENRRIEIKEEILDKLQRYEAHYWRIFLRATSELERFQRMRPGDAVPLPITVNVSD